jgi:hypothetical protein
MDALKYIPDDIDHLATEKGIARLQKTDIFKKLMWFSYPNEDSWIPLEIDRVKEIQKLNKEGIKPEDLKDEAVELEAATVSKVLDYENVVGQDSITRLDEKARKKKKRNNRSKSQNQNAGPSPEVDGTPAKQNLNKVHQQAIKAAVENTETKPANNNHGSRNNNRRRNKNRNPNRSKDGGNE